MSGDRRRVLDRAARILASPLTVPASRQRGSHAVAILGAPVGVGGGGFGGLPPVLAERLAAGLELYESGLSDLVCVTGTRAEAEALAAAARDRGVPDTDLLIDRDASNTRENAANLAELLSARGRTTVWVATQPFHSRRACFWFRRFGLEPLACHLPDSLQYADPHRAVRWIAREYVSWANLAIRMLLG